jgi:hypothetical protein
MVSSAAYIEANREIINYKRRMRYDSEARKKEYNENREVILKQKRNDRSECPLCKLEYRRLYIPQHLVTRHKISKEEACMLCS